MALIVGLASAGKLLICAALLMIVPTLCVGRHPVTLRVTPTSLNARRPLGAERPGRRCDAERGNDRMSASEPASSRLKPVPLKATSAVSGNGLFPAKAGHTNALRTLRRTGFSREAVDLLYAFDLPKQKAQSPPSATWVQAERRSSAVGRAAWMRRERRQDMDVRSARAHGAGPE